METAYDILIIGSEISGLISAALLAKKGIRVAIVGDAVKPASYEKNGYIFNERPFPITGLHGGPLGEVLDEIGLSKGVFRNAAISYQVVLPDERVDIYEGTGLFHEELRRCFPQYIDKVSAFYSHTADINGKIDQIMELNPFSFRLLLPYWIARGRKPIKDAIERIDPDQRFQSFISAQLSSFSFMPGGISLIAASSTLESSRKGIYCMEGGSDALRALLMKKIRTLGGDIIEARVKDMSRNGNRWLLRTEDEAFSGRAVIGNIDARTFCNLFLDGGKKYLKKAERIEKACYPLTINIGVKEDGIPAGMAENVVMLRDYKKEYHSDNLLFMQISPSANGRRSLSITCKVSKEEFSLKERLREITEKMLEGVEELCPFIDIHTEVLDIRSPESGWDGIYTTTLSQRMGVGVLPPEIVRGDVVFAGPEVFPTLGFDGLVYSGRMAAAAVLKGLEKGKA
ncbi:MAG: Neurosporene desaturase [Deltaproteobacteria bacterium]|nr:Neurosporene desaturase [Deltaproteobacteria bacterium]